MIDWLTLPPLTALRAFAAFAETGSVISAGTALNVSHAAISQQLRALETHMGVALVDRSGRAMALTVEGRQLASALRTGFGAIAASVEALTGADAARPLHIATTPMFAAGWLMPQMPQFHEAHPGTHLILSASAELQTLDPGGIDVALRYGAGDWPGVETQLLLRSPMLLVGAPSLVGEDPICNLSVLARYPVLQDMGRSEANLLLEEMGVIGPSEGPPARRVQLPGNLLLDAARDGQGVAVVTRAFVEKDLEAGRLRLLYEHQSDNGYYIVTRPGVQRPVTKTFIRWLLMRQEAGGTAA
ncbi:LysR family transcriptional regulator [Roseovarius sp. CH_XMU1461]|jgi:LysR family glycine cleavage system transcriptional activator|uniref:LysR family transcriptional regulator n=1 Tax=Roseovarius sp. CH_XMU1461 TaxID=3107777 RepID=UPI003008A2F8